MTAATAGYAAGPAGRVRVPAGPAHQRVGSLVAAGWTQAELARRLGMSSANLSAVMGRERISAAMDAAVGALYGELAGRMPPEETLWERAAADRARGWEPPPGHIRPPWSSPRTGPPPLPAGRHRCGDLVKQADELTLRYGVKRRDAAARLGVTLDALAQAYSRVRRQEAAGESARPLGRPTRAFLARAGNHDSEEMIMTARRGGPLKGEALAEECAEHARRGLTRAEMAERTGATMAAIDQAITRRNRRLAAAGGALPEAGGALPEAGGGRAGCGTILALLLHQALGEEICGECAVNAAGRGYTTRTTDHGKLAA